VKRTPSFATALVFWFVAGMTTEVALAHAIDHWSDVERRSREEAICSLRGGTLVQREEDVSCLTCNVD